MSAVTSRAMLALEAAIAQARDQIHNACLRAERAGLLARHGHLEQARAELADLHARQQRLSNPGLAAWMCLAEGLVAHFSELGGQARDRIMRAHALAGAARLRPLLALSAAWLAHMDYVRHDIAAMARHVVEALQEAALDHHAARARACLVVAEGYHFGARLDLAQPWYEQARRHATVQGDQATLSALMHNRAWQSGNQARLASIFEPDAEDRGRVRQALMSAESTGYFDQWVGTASLNSLVPVLRAQLHVVQGEHARALALYDEHLAVAMQEGLARMRAVFHADVAWCKLHLGRRDEALADARAAEAGLDADCDVDDRAVAYGRLAQVFGVLDMGDDAKRHAALAELDLRTHREQQVRIVAALDAALANVHGSANETPPNRKR